MNLYHFTCSHSAPRIKADGFLRPWIQPVLSVSLIWLTDLDDPTREQVGLTSYSLTCDRLEYRVTVDTAAVRWTTFARTAPARRALELTPGALPMHWWVSEARVPIQLVERDFACVVGEDA